MKESQARQAASLFAQRWQGQGYEKGQTQKFWLELLEKVLGVDDPYSYITFEDQVHLDHTSFMDAYIPSTHVLIEQKGISKDLRAPIVQSDGTALTPFQQAKRYSAELPYTLRPRWVVTCNFRSFLIYDMEQPNNEPYELLLQNLEAEHYRLQFLVSDGREHLRREMEVSLKAGEIVGRIYDTLLTQYRDPDDPASLRSLNVLCTRLVFCLYAEDAGIFAKDQFHDYLSRYRNSQGDMRRALIDLFLVLDTRVPDRDPYLADDLAAFPYVNGGLFADAHVEIPRLNDDIADLLLTHASMDFDWSQISPTIFGAVFESTLNPDTRRSGGMHYTSIENIHKVIDPLFLDDLRAELADIQADANERLRQRRARAFQERLAALRFLDPACGSGNFLTETYLSLRRLENEAITIYTQGQSLLGFDELNPVRVDIHQFYGIEINDFAVATATTALWIAENQMMNETERIIHRDLDMLPLKAYHNIVEGNALRMDWNDVIPASELHYIMGNPPFVGARMKNKEQGDDIVHVFGAKWKNVGNLDYVGCWYKKAADYTQGTAVRCALVSTNSITQGEQVADLWKPLVEDSGVHIDFAYRTFRWDSESSLKAHVHCVIVGFSVAPNDKPKRIYDGDSFTIARNINGYLIDAEDVFIESRSNPLSDVPTIGIGNKPIDGGFYLFTEEEKDEFIKQEPASAPYFKMWYGSYEFINRKPRYCLWLGDCSPAVLRTMPKCMERVAAVRNYRLSSPSAGTVKLADKPTRFHVENMPKGSYIVIPQVSSQRRRYIPMGYMDDTVICSDKVRILADGTLYHLGVLESNVHMSWMRAICCRLKSDYSYTVNDVYNNFPWPNPTEEQKAKIEATAQGILDARALYPDCSLADLYDEVTMPVELRRAHQANDRAVMNAYGLPVGTTTESDCVAHLLKLYQELTK